MDNCARIRSPNHLLSSSPLWSPFFCVAFIFRSTRFSQLLLLSVFYRKNTAVFATRKGLEGIPASPDGFWIMALRRMLGYSDGELMRSDAKPCSRLMRQTAGIFSVGGALGFWVLCRLHYGPRITVPRSLRWATCGAISMSSSTALLVRLFSPECEPQNIAAYDKKG
ncbi:uncharacterized protein LOC107803245 isoform X2 [Nicotiana tabacum]|uniref:Uncharacterized protein LOC107803245 isoform X2 n=1 Tax=Nicotiana tabacum TaxID=4097 RepID=A0AC58UEM9_TOBAC